jgi:hypothetical protein
MELTREILLHVAYSSTLATHRLRLVSRYVNVWVLPLLFHTLFFTTNDQIIRFASTLLPKRKIHIPAIQSNLHTIPRSLSSYSIDSLALAVTTRLPSTETALASVAPAFTGLKNLALTAQNLSSHAHWLRQHPIHPQQVMIFHFGRPHPVNFREPLFNSVTHLHTSVLLGHRRSSVGDLPALTHLAVYTRIDLQGSVIGDIARLLYSTLVTLPRLKSLVLSLNGSALSDDLHAEPWFDPLLPCIQDKRFAFLPYIRIPRLEWQDIISGKQNIWERAEEWGRIASEDRHTRIMRSSQVLKAVEQENSVFPPVKKYVELEWEIDLVQRDDFSELATDPMARRE